MQADKLPNPGSNMAPDTLRAGMPAHLDQPSRSETGARDQDDVFELLKVDHDRIASLFLDIFGSDEDVTADAFMDLYEVVMVHAETEEAVFYPTVGAFPDTKGWI